MNWAKFKGPVSLTCLAGAVAGSNPFTVMPNIFVTEFSENI